MGLRIATNLASLQTTRILSHSGEEQRKSFQKLASGQRIINAGDDAAGLSISENLRGQIRSMAQAERNANEGVSFSQVAEGGLTEVGNNLIRLRELAIQAASDTVGDRERGFIDKEVQNLVQEVDRIANVTSFNGTSLLNGQAEKGVLEFQVGIQGTDLDRISFDASELDVRSSTLGIDGISVASIDDARESIEKIDEAMSTTFANRAALGATQSRLLTTVRSIEVGRENLSAARSRISDVDMATETSEMTRGNILQSAGIAVLTQANSAPALALKLL